jgi:predicted cytidylate kinase
MRIAISGKAGSGKSTVAKLLSKKLGLRHYSIGDLMRAMAAEKGITLLQLNSRAEKDKSIDLELDNKLRELGKKKDNFIVDGRLASYFIPNADAKIFLKTDDKVRAQRIMNDKRHQEKGNMKEVMSKISKREESEKKRYQKYYGINYLDKRLYNLVVDTTKLSPNEVVGSIVKFLKPRHEMSDKS